MFKTVLKWLAITVAGLVVLALLIVAGIYLHIGNDLNRAVDVIGSPVEVPSDPEAVAEGARLAQTRGCFGGCHGDTTEGEVFFDLFDGTNFVAPSLGVAARNYSDEELERAIRHGVRRDGTGLLLLMPSTMFYHLSDKDLGSIIAFLRTRPVDENDLTGGSYFGPVARLLLLTFKQDTGSLLGAELIDHEAPRLDPGYDNLVARGRYLATTSCTECHGEDLAGEDDDPDFITPDLAVVAAYPLEAFRHLMRTGEPVSGNELDLMAAVAQSRFSYFTDDEIDALYAYLQTLPVIRGE